MLDYFYAIWKKLILLSHSILFLKCQLQRTKAPVVEASLWCLSQSFVNDHCICVGQGISHPLEVSEDVPLFFSNELGIKVIAALNFMI